MHRDPGGVNNLLYPMCKESVCLRARAVRWPKVLGNCLVPRPSREGRRRPSLSRGSKRSAVTPGISGGQRLESVVTGQLMVEDGRCTRHEAG